MPALGLNGRPLRAPSVLRILVAPVLGLLFVVTLPLLGLAAIAWGLGRPAAGTPARPAGDPSSGRREPRSSRPAAGTGR